MKTLLLLLCLAFSPVSSAKGKEPAATPNIVVTLPQSWLSAQGKDLGKILQTFKAVPYMDEEKKFAGFLIASVDDDSPVKRFKVQKGDILKQVGDVSFDTPGKGLEAFQSNRKPGAPIELRLIRDGKPLTIIYKIQPPPKKPKKK